MWGENPARAVYRGRYPGFRTLLLDWGEEEARCFPTRRVGATSTRLRDRKFPESLLRLEFRVQKRKAARQCDRDCRASRLRLKSRSNLWWRLTLRSPISNQNSGAKFGCARANKNRTIEFRDRPGGVIPTILRLR